MNKLVKVVILGVLAVISAYFAIIMNINFLDPPLPGV